MNNVVSIVNSQDAVGKSTTAWHLARNMAAMGSRTLLVDCDPLSGLKARLPRVAAAWDRPCFLSEGIDAYAAVTVISERLHALVGSTDLVAVELKDVRKAGRELMLKSLLDNLADDYDCAVIDTPSSLGLLTVNALVASDSVIVPICCDYFGMDGMTQVMNAIKNVADEHNDRLRLEGLLLTRYDDSLRSTERNLKELSHLFGDMMMQTVIRESNDPDADYAELAAELLRRWK